MGVVERHRTAATVAAGAFAVISSADSALSLWERIQAGLDFGEVLAVLRLASGPLALILVILLIVQRPSARGPIPIPADWSALDQSGHWQKVRNQALNVESRLREVTSSPQPTVQDQTAIREAVDSLDFQVNGYTDLWEPGAYWDAGSRARWERVKKIRPNPAWAQPLWERVDYAQWWLSRHDPADRSAMDDWGSWSEITG
jgi:hypothetical protein